MLPSNPWLLGWLAVQPIHKYVPVWVATAPIFKAPLSVPLKYDLPALPSQVTTTLFQVLVFTEPGDICVFVPLMPTHNKYGYKEPAEVVLLLALTNNVIVYPPPIPPDFPNIA